MAVNFPTSLDTLTNPTATDYLNSPSHATQHSNANDILEELEAKVGINGSAVTTSHDYKLSGVAVTDKAASLTGSETLTNKTVDATSPTAFNFVGKISACALRSAPTGWLICDGSAISRATYAALYAAITPSIGTFTVTIASPAVVTLNGHGLNTGDPVFLTTTGALPTGLTANTIYYAIKIDANTFNLAITFANANAGTKINTSGSQSGIHTLRFCPFGLGDGSTTFNVPNLLGRTIVGLDISQAEFDTIGNTPNVGAKTHTLTEAQLASHNHQGATDSAGAVAFGPYILASTINTGAGGANRNNLDLTAKGGNQAHNNLQPYHILNYIIKT